jgi:hypothetical protein
LSAINYGKICRQFKEKLGDAFIRRVERRIAQDFGVAVEENPYKLLVSIIEDIHLYFVSPFEMTMEIADYLKEKYEVDKFSLALSSDFYLSPTENMDEIKRFVKQFYLMIKELGFSQKFTGNRIKWWAE